MDAGLAGRHPSLPVLQTGLSFAWTGAWEMPPSPQGSGRLCLAVLVLTAVAPREGGALGF